MSRARLYRTYVVDCVDLVAPRNDLWIRVSDFPILPFALVLNSVPYLSDPGDSRSSAAATADAVAKGCDPGDSRRASLKLVPLVPMGDPGDSREARRFAPGLIEGVIDIGLIERTAAASVAPVAPPQ